MFKSATSSCRQKLAASFSWGTAWSHQEKLVTLKCAAAPEFGLAPIQRIARANYTNDARKESRKEGQEPREKVSESKEKQIRTPWHRADLEQTPVSRQGNVADMEKGKLLTTPSRMLKVLLPLRNQVKEDERKDVTPLAFIVHPHQPLSYLERLIQSEIPMITDTDGKEKIPAVYFRAEDLTRDRYAPKKDEDTSKLDEDDAALDDRQDRNDGFLAGTDDPLSETTRFPNRAASDNALNAKTPEQGKEPPGPVEAPPARAAPGERTFVRWSPSTEIGDFIRDAADGREFAIEIEGAPGEIWVEVPSFEDRTYYLRTRLRKTSRKIASMADIKRECDQLAHRGARRVAIGGFGILCGWWYVVYRLTFLTELGWDVMEPVTYLVSLSAIIGGYVWFLYHNREVSYRSAMNITISRRQSALYNARGLDLAKWEALIQEGNALRREIKAVAAEYNVEWDEAKDELDERVMEELRNKRKEEKRKRGSDSDDD